LKGRAKPYINAEIFLEYIRTAFLSILNELRSLEEFAEENAVRLMDNWRATLANRFSVSEGYASPDHNLSTSNDAHLPGARCLIVWTPEKTRTISMAIR
jgi:hypothetical protein